MRITGELHLPVASLPPDFVAYVQERLTFDHPEWLSARRMGRRLIRVPKKLYAFRIEGDELIVPRGIGLELAQRLEAYDGISVRYVDETRTERPISFSRRMTPRPDQRRALQAAARRNHVILGPTGSGKTLVGMLWIADRAQPALWIVHTRDLADQAVEAAHRVLGLQGNQVGRIEAGRWDVRLPRDGSPRPDAVAQCGSPRRLARRLRRRRRSPPRARPHFLGSDRAAAGPQPSRPYRHAGAQRRARALVEAAIGPIAYRMTDEGAGLISTRKLFG